MKSFRTTLNLFPVSFRMRANLVEQEPRWLRLWSQLQIGQHDQRNSAWQLHDGPIFANGVVHLGHGLNRVVKDIWVRHHYGRGRPASVCVGWDTHGWPIVNAVYRHHPAVNFRDQPVLLRRLAGRYVREQISRQQKVFNQLGLLTNWSHRYRTDCWRYERRELAIFQLLLRRGLFYRALKPTLWCCASQQVVPEVGVQYRLVPTDHVFVLLPVVEPARYQLPAKVAVLIWTTTPWTLPANQLVAINPQLVYVVVAVKRRHFIVAQSLLANVADQCNWPHPQVVTTVLPSTLLRLRLRPPFGDGLVSVIGSGHVTSTNGTGCVHVAGAFGRDDYQLVVRAGLTPKVVINGDGCYNAQVPWSPLVGVRYLEANVMIVRYLSEHDRLVFAGQIKHSAPFEARTQQPLIYLASWQWFLRLDLVKTRLSVLFQGTDWTPAWSKQHLQNMLARRDDWCVSRQRPWGVPLLEFFDEHGRSHLTTELVQFAVERLRQFKSCDPWWTEPCDYFLPPDYRGRGWRKGSNVLDVWFDSGCSFVASVPAPLTDPLRIRFAGVAEGKDQFRGWFNTTMIISGLLSDRFPFQKVLVHGFVTDQTGVKFSKSHGNALTLTQFIGQHGVDVWRLMVANAELPVDLGCGSAHLTEVKTQYRKIRNTFRFMLAHLVDYRHQHHRQANLTVVDRFILAELRALRQASDQLIDRWRYAQLLQQIMFLVTVTLSGFYFEAAKPTLYADAVNSQRRRQIQTTLFYLVIGLLSVVKPILVFTSEEVYQHLPPFAGKLASVHQVRSFKWRWPIMSRQERADWHQILALKLDLNSALDVALHRQLIDDRDQACATFWLKKPLHTKVDPAVLAAVLRVGIVRVQHFDDSFCEYKSSWIKISSLVNRQKCARCWRFWDQLTPSGICFNCHTVLRSRVVNCNK